MRVFGQGNICIIMDIFLAVMLGDGVIRFSIVARDVTPSADFFIVAVLFKPPVTTTPLGEVWLEAPRDVRSFRDTSASLFITPVSHEVSDVVVKAGGIEIGSGVILSASARNQVIPLHEVLTRILFREPSLISTATDEVHQLLLRGATTVAITVSGKPIEVKIPLISSSRDS